MAVASRFMWGLLNGNIGVAKTYLAEICDDSNSAKGMALFGVIGGFGRSIGPVIGGFLSTPAKAFPKTFKGTVFDTYPFALPSLVIAVNCLVVFLVALIALPETLPSIVNADSREVTKDGAKDGAGTYSLLHEKDDEEEEMSPSNGNSAIELPPWSADKGNTNGASAGDDEEESKEHLETPNKKKLTFAGVVTVKTIGSQALGFGPLKGVDSLDRPLRASLRNDEALDDIEQGESHALDDGARSPPFSPLAGPVSILKASRSSSTNNNGPSQPKTINFSSEDDDRTIARVESNDQDNHNEDEDEESKLIDPHVKHKRIVGKIRYTNGSEDETVVTRGRGFWRMLQNIFQQPEIMISTALYGTNALSIIVFNEIFPLWVVTSIESGGFEFTSYQIGVSTMISGVLGIVLQVTLYPYMTDRWGVLFVHKAGVLAFALSCIAVPCASLVNNMGSPFLTWLVIVSSQLLINVTSTWVLVSVFVLINNSCYSYQRATVNGLGQTFASLGRLMGPFSGATIFAWSENNGLGWPLNFYLAFYLMAIIGFGNWFMANHLPLSIQRRKKEPGVAMPPRRRRRAHPDDDDDDLQPTHPPEAPVTQQSNLSKGQGLPMP